MSYYMNVDGVELRVEVSFDEYGLDVERVYVRSSESDISHLLIDGVLKEIENKCLEQLEERKLEADLDKQRGL